MEKITRLLSSLTGAHYPAVLPGIRGGDAFVFADSLGFHAVAMTSIGDEEPKVTLSLLSRLLVGADFGAEEIMAPSVGKSAAELVGLETGRYRQCALAVDSLGPWLSLAEGFFVPLDDVLTLPLESVPHSRVMN